MKRRNFLKLFASIPVIGVVANNSIEPKKHSLDGFVVNKAESIDKTSLSISDLEDLCNPRPVCHGDIAVRVTSSNNDHVMYFIAKEP